MTDIQQAREWAENGAVKVNSGEVIDEIAKAAVRVIQSLPDQWVDAEKVREEADRMDRGAENSMKPGHNEFSRGYAEAMQECAEHLRNLLTPLPDLPKLEWPSLAVTEESDPAQEPDGVAFATGGALTTQDVVDECRAVRKERATMEPTLPSPEDVPAGEPWIVLCGGKRWVGVRADTPARPWSITRMDGLDCQNVADSKIALISRLVPEVKP